MGSDNLQLACVHCTTSNFLPNTMVIIVEMVIVVEKVIMVKMLIMVEVVIMVKMNNT